MQQEQVIKDNDQRGETLDIDELIVLAVGELIKEKGLDNLDEKKKNILGDVLTEKLTDEINRSLLIALPEEKLDEINMAMDRDNVTEDEIIAIVESSHLNSEEIIKDTIAKFKDAFLGLDVNKMLEEAKEE